MSQNNDVVLGKDLSNGKRTVAFLSIALIYFFYCYNFMISTFTKVAMIDGFGFSLLETETIYSFMTIGTIIGTFFFGSMAARVGKKRTLIILAFSIAITTAIPFLSPENVMVWTVARTMTGTALGGMFGTCMPLVADMFPSKYRGKLAAFLTSLYSLSMIFGGWVYGVLGSHNWEGLMLTAIIPPAIGGILVYMFVPDDHDMAVAAYEKSVRDGEKISYVQMFKGKYLLIGLGVICLSACNKTGYAAFSNNSTAYMESIGLSAAMAGSIFAAQGVGQTFGYWIWGAIADKYGRKKPRFGMALVGVLLIGFIQLSSDQTTLIYATSVLIGFCVGFSGCWGAYYSEIFPEKYRSISAGVSFNGGYIIAAFINPVVATFTSASNLVPMYMVAIVLFVLGSVIWSFLPETLNKKAEEAKGDVAIQK